MNWKKIETEQEVYSISEGVCLAKGNPEMNPLEVIYTLDNIEGDGTFELSYRRIEIKLFTKVPRSKAYEDGWHYSITSIK